MKIDYEICPNLNDASHDIDDIINAVEDMAKIRRAVDEVFADLVEIPKNGEQFLWKSGEESGDGDVDHILFMFYYEEEGEPWVLIEHCCIWIESEPFANGLMSHLFLEMSDSGFTYERY
jgi:hypothetical protein